MPPNKTPRRARPTTLYLPGIGTVRAVPYSEVTVGDELMWNGGLKSVVVSIEPAGPKSLTVTTEFTEGAQGGITLWTCRRLRTTLVCRTKKAEQEVSISELIIEPICPLDKCGGNLRWVEDQWYCPRCENEWADDHIKELLQ